MLSQFSSFRDSMIRQLNLFTDSVDLFFQRRQDRKLEPFFEEFDWLYELHLADKLDDDYLELSLRKMTHSDQYHFLLALDEYVIIHSELLWLDIICSPHEKNGPKRMTKSLKTFLQICLATKKSFYINSFKECQKNQITTKMLEYFSPIFVLENDFKTFRNLVKNCINIYIEGRIKNGFFHWFLLTTNPESPL